MVTIYLMSLLFLNIFRGLNIEILHLGLVANQYLGVTDSFVMDFL